MTVNSLECADLSALCESQQKRRQVAALQSSPMMHWLKFNLVGISGFALQTLVLFALTHSNFTISYLAATAIAVEFAVLNNFVWHQRWTWRDRPTSSMTATALRLLKFNATTGAVSLSGNLLLMSLLVGRLGLPVSPANVITVVGCSLLSFVLADRVAFTPRDC